MLRKIRVYGRLAKFLGQRVLEADVATAAEAVRFLVTNWPELERHMADQHYRVSVGGYDLSAEELHDPAGQQEIKIIPVIGGAGGNSTWQILAGVALIALSFIPGIGALGVSLMIGAGASLVLGGVAQLLMPVPSTDTSEQDPTESFSFSGIQQTSREGVPVPIVYGEMLVGSVVVSAAIDTKAL